MVTSSPRQPRALFSLSSFIFHLSSRKEITPALVARPAVPKPIRRRPLGNRALLAERLDELTRSFDLSSISPDPLEVVRDYHAPDDQEIAGLIAAAFAYGRAGIVVRNVRWILERLGPSPTGSLRRFDPSTANAHFAGFSHRFHKTPDLVALLTTLASALDRHGSLATLFERCYEPADAHIGPSLERFIDALVEGIEPAPPSLRYLLSSPRDGSACKRMNLFLRWMVRTEEPDLGLWRFVDPAKLVIPLDTHVHRITSFLGLNGRKSADWRTALAVTEELRRFDPADPVRFDYAICRLGVLDQCSRKQRREQCEVCLLNDVCRLRVV
jgi:uncharacterized protein (TIGR02757 family)